MAKNNTTMERHVESMMQNIHSENLLRNLDKIGEVLAETKQYLLKWQAENKRMRNLIETSAKMEAELLNNNYQSNNVKEDK